MSESVPNQREGRRLAPILVIGAAIMVGGLTLPWLGGPPAFEDLVRVSGEVNELRHKPKTRYGDRKITIVLAGDAAGPISFDSGLCYAGARKLSSGTQVAAWLDGEPQTRSADFRAWQIEAGGVVVCDYAATIAQSKRSAVNARVMGGTFALMGLGLMLAPLLTRYPPQP